ncbi:MAG: PKD-like family lipoprotein [Rikenellaceae bacterium]|nr:PKD-like family lipoprotein [Rikenellaceae bacterium]MCL2692140.1 PKD-like family lipoprotein [Rikenellaceae bacterium]
MKKIKFLLGIIAFTVFAGGCYEDLGNYTYRDINEVIVKVERQYAVRRADMEYVIRPQLIQSMALDTTNLSFEWYWNTSSDQIRGTLISTRDTVAVRINPAAVPFHFNHYFRFYVKDNITGAQYMFPVHLRVIKPYEGSWMVLHEGSDGLARLGAVEYIGDEIQIEPNAYFRETGRNFTGRPVRLGVATYFMAYLAPAYSPTCLFFCFTDNPAESGPLKADAYFEQYDTPLRFIFPEHLASFDPADIQYVGGEGRGRLMVSGGELFQGSMYDTKMYRVSPAVDFTGNYNITHGTCSGWTQLAFDSYGKRFVHFYNSNSANANWSNFQPATENAATFGRIRLTENSVQDVDPNSLPADQEIVFIGTGYHYGPSMVANQARHAIYGLTVSEAIGRLYFYEFHGYSLYNSGDPNDPPFAFYNDIANTMGINTATPVASSSAYNRLLFYGNGNTVYRLDMGTEQGAVATVYEHPNPAARVVAIKAARDQMNGAGVNYTTVYANYGHAVTRSFAVAYEMPDGSGELVVLNLNTAGRRESVQEGLTGFGRITDIVFI